MPTQPKPVPPERRRVRRGNEDDANALRAELLAAAMHQFAHGGLEAVTMRGVAGAVGVSVMTPYRYFADKADLLGGLGQSVIRAVCDRMTVAIAAAKTGSAKQRASLDAFLGYWEEHPDHYRLVYMTEQTTGRDAPSNMTRSPVYAEIVELVAGVTRAVAAEIGASLANARLAGDIRFMMQLGYLHATLVNRRYEWSDRAPLRAAYIEQIVATVERCLLAGKARAPAKAGRRKAARTAQ